MKKIITLLIVVCSLAQIADAAVNRAALRNAIRTRLLAAISRFSGEAPSNADQLVKEANDALAIAQKSGATDAEKTNAANKAIAAANALVAAGRDHDAAGLLAGGAIDLVGTKEFAAANPATAASISAAATQIASNPLVAKSDPVTAAFVATLATYVVNLPAVANNPAAQSNVAATKNSVTTVSNNTDVKSAPANATMTADLSAAVNLGASNTDAVVNIVPGSSTGGTSTPPVDVTIKTVSPS